MPSKNREEFLEIDPLQLYSESLRWQMLVTFLEVELRYSMLLFIMFIIWVCSLTRIFLRGYYVVGWECFWSLWNNHESINNWAMNCFSGNHWWWSNKEIYCWRYFYELIYSELPVNCHNAKSGIAHEGKIHSRLIAVINTNLSHNLFPYILPDSPMHPIPFECHTTPLDWHPLQLHKQYARSRMDPSLICPGNVVYYLL